MRNARVKYVPIWLVTLCVCGIAGAQPAGEDFGDKYLRIQAERGEELKQDASLDLRLESSYPDLALLDGFEPQAPASLTRVPHGPDGSIPILPGLWHMWVESYCLTPGAYAPSTGEGHVPVRLAGPRADLVARVLQQSHMHPDIDQKSVQLLLWSILLRTRVSQLAPAAQQAAHAMLTADEISRLEQAASEREAIDAKHDKRLQEAIFGPGGILADLPPELRAEMGTEDELRRSISTSAAASYDTVSALAVLQGNPPPIPDDMRPVPYGRWAYCPYDGEASGGCVMRFLPRGYKTAQLQFYAPEHLTLEADALGRVTLLADAAGNRLEVAYDDAVPPLAFGKDPGIKGYAIGRIRITGPRRPDDFDTMAQAEYEDVGWVTVGLPWANGGTPESAGRFPGAAERYAWACEQKAEIQRIDAEFSRIHQGRQTPPKALLGDVMDLSSLCRGVKTALEQQTPENSPEYPFLGDRIGLAYRALASEILYLAHWRPAETTRTGALPPNGSQAGGIRMCAYTTGAVDLLPQALWGYSRSGGRSIPECTWDPYGGEAPPYFNPRTASYSSNPGSQNLGYSTKPAATPVNTKSNNNFKQAQQYSDTVVKVFDKAHGAAGVPQPYTVQLTIVQKIIQFNVSSFKDAGDRLEKVGTDPPRDDYDQIARPSVPQFPDVQGGEGVDAELLSAWRGFYNAQNEMTAILRAFAISQDRHGGAMRAGDGRWAATQAAVMVEYQRQGGEAMLRTADALEAWVNTMKARRVPELWITPEAMRETQQELEARGFSPEELAVARQWGMSEEEIEQVRQSLLRTPAPTHRTGLLTSCTRLAGAMRNLGDELRRLPQMPLP